MFMPASLPTLPTLPLAAPSTALLCAQPFREVYLKGDWRKRVVDQEYNARIKKIPGVRSIYVEALKSDPSKRAVGSASMDGHGAINLAKDIKKMEGVDFRALWDSWMVISQQQIERNEQTDEHFPSLYVQVRWSHSCCVYARR